MKILLDTDVLIAALIAQGVCHDLLEYCVIKHDLVTSEFILHVTQAKLVEKFGYPLDAAFDVADLLRSRLEVVRYDQLPEPVSRDPDDDNVLAAAVAGACDCIITGDQDLLVLGSFRGVRILNPRQFLEHEASI